MSPSLSMQWINALWAFLHSVDEILLGAFLQYPAWVLLALFAVLLLESSMCPFLPGDTLLFAAGVALRASPLSVHVAAALFLTASVLGVTANYYIGRRLRLRLRTTGLWGFGREELSRTELLMTQHGPRMLVLGRFLPGVRTAVPLLAGAGRMPFGRFTLYNVLGGLPWIILFTYGGYYFGGIPGVEAYLVPILLLLLAFAIVPFLVTWGRAAWRRSHP